jgi:hypothetical protein
MMRILTLCCGLYHAYILTFVMHRLSGGQVSQEIGGNVGELPPLVQSLASISWYQQRLYIEVLVSVQCDQFPLKHFSVCGSKATTKQPRIMLVVTYLLIYLPWCSTALFTKILYFVSLVLARQKMFDLFQIVNFYAVEVITTRQLTKCE